MDDWILATYNIPSVTGEIGSIDDFIDEWTVKSADKAYQIVTENQPWLEHTFQKIGTQLKMKPVTYFEYSAPKNGTSLAQKTEMLANEKLITVKLNVTNSGLSDMSSPYDLEISNLDVSIVSSDQQTDGLRHLKIEPLKSRETKLVQMTLKVQDDANGKYSKAL